MLLKLSNVIHRDIITLPANDEESHKRS